MSQVSSPALSRIAQLFAALGLFFMLAPLAHAARTVFSRRHAMVMGPTPPGTGVMKPARSRAAPEPAPRATPLARAARAPAHVRPSPRPAG